MLRLLHMVALDVGNVPQVARILAERVARQLPCFRPLEVLLARILLRDSDRIEVEEVVVRLSEPDDRFVPSGEALRTMKPVLEQNPWSIRVYLNRFADCAVLCDFFSFFFYCFFSF